MTEKQDEYKSAMDCDSCLNMTDEGEKCDICEDGSHFMRIPSEYKAPAKKKTGFCECETCQAHRGGKTDKDKLWEYLERGKQTEKPEVNGESVKDYNRDQEGMPCDFCSHHVFGAPSYCVTCDPENSNYEPCDFEAVNNHAVDVDEMVRGKALKKALEIINGERQDSYGNPENSFALIAEYWNAYLIELQKAVLVRHGFDPADYKLVDMLEGRHVAEMMALFKIARMSGQKTTADSYADCAGYIGLAGDMI